MQRSSRIGIAGVSMSLLTGAACAALRPPPARVADRDTEERVESRWHVAFATNGHTTNAPPAAPMTGWASMRAGTRSANTSIRLNVVQGTPGAVHPWQLHHGHCGADRGVYGPASAYEPMTVDSGGRGVGQATVRMPLPAKGPFFVRVAVSPAAPDSIVACGDLVPPRATD